ARETRAGAKRGCLKQLCATTILKNAGSIIDKEQAKWWQKKHSSLMAYMVSGDDISVTDHSHYITQMRAAEKVMSDFGLTFTPFEPELKVTTE
ncbi:hypothetical protein, partial [Aeromonas caviae]